MTVCVNTNADLNLRCDDNGRNEVDKKECVDIIIIVGNIFISFHSVIVISTTRMLLAIGMNQSHEMECIFIRNQFSKSLREALLVTTVQCFCNTSNSSRSISDTRHNVTEALKDAACLFIYLWMEG
uniref:Uncharacterized protein n=1 Tax=Anopheles culicifacies TaxID=139723 RepID=A0A182MKI9_9DIPT